MQASPKHEALYQELVAVLKKHGATLTPEELLAIGANMVGKLIAMQDQRVTSPERAMNIVMENIKLGNEQAIAAVMNTRGSA